MMIKPQTKTLALTEDRLSALRAALTVQLDKNRDVIRSGSYASTSYIGSLIQVYNMTENLKRGEAPDWNLERVPRYLRDDPREGGDPPKHPRL